MKPSERISVISEISSRLSGAEWPLIDLTLKQFSLPWTDEWSGEKDAYIIQMIEDADDEKLLELAHHVGIEVGGHNVGIDPPFGKMDILGYSFTFGGPSGVRRLSQRGA